MSITVEFAGICTHIEDDEKKLHRVVIFDTGEGGVCNIQAHKAELVYRETRVTLLPGTVVSIDGGTRDITYDPTYAKLVRLGKHPEWQHDLDVVSGKSTRVAYFVFHAGCFRTICTKKDGPRLVQVEVDAGPNPKLVFKDGTKLALSKDEKICVRNVSIGIPKPVPSHFHLHYVGLVGGRCALPNTPAQPERNAPKEGTPICALDIISLGPECSNAGFP